MQFELDTVPSGQSVPGTLPVSLQEFSTANSPRAKRSRYWNDLISSSFGGMTVDAAEPGRFAGRMKRATLGELVFANPQQSDSLVRHTRAHISAQVADRFFLHLQLAGMTLYRQRGREAELAAGDIVLCSTLEPYSVQVKQDSQVLVIGLPGHRLRRIIPEPDDLACVPLRGAHGGMPAIAAEHVSAIWRQLERGRLTSAPVELIDSIVLAVSCAFRSAEPPARVSGGRGARRREQLLAYVRSRIQDAGLTVSAAASALGMSTSNVRKLMREEGTGLAAYILAHRLQGAAQWLADPRRARLTVAEIAFGWGFSDLSHFSRAFRRQVGHSPGRYRHRHTVRAP